jgi:hypothetical protein
MTKNASKQSKTCNGFAVPLTPTTDLGSATLIAEDENGGYEPVAVVGSIAEGHEMAASDLRARMRRLECGEDAGICPHQYVVWARGVDGVYISAATLLATSL